MEALRDVLRQISAIQVKEMFVDSHERRGGKTILGRVEIHGHVHLLACKVVSSREPERLERAVRELKEIQKKRGAVVMPILIATDFPGEAEKVCRKSNAGFLDLAGNARIYLDEVFIVRRSMPRHKELPSQAEQLPTSETAHFAQVA